MSSSEKPSNNLYIHQTQYIDKKVFTVYSDKGRCDLAEFDIQEINKVSGYQLIKSDLNLIIAQSRIAINIRKELDSKPRDTNLLDITDERQVICSGLYASCIVTYAKCFTSNIARNAKIEEKELKKRITNEQIKSHDELMDLRHQWIAHAGNNKKEAKTQFLAFYENEKGGTSFRPIFLGTTDPMPEIIKLEAIIFLSTEILKLITEVTSKIERKFHSKHDIVEIAKKLEKIQFAEFKI